MRKIINGIRIRSFSSLKKLISPLDKSINGTGIKNSIITKELQG